jgi:hypothetical protein
MTTRTKESPHNLIIETLVTMQTNKMDEKVSSLFFLVYDTLKKYNADKNRFYYVGFESKSF